MVKCRFSNQCGKLLPRRLNLLQKLFQREFFLNFPNFWNYFSVNIVVFWKYFTSKRCLEGVQLPPALSYPTFHSRALPAPARSLQHRERRKNLWEVPHIPTIKINHPKLIWLFPFLARTSAKQQLMTMHFSWNWDILKAIVTCWFWVVICMGGAFQCLLPMFILFLFWGKGCFFQSSVLKILHKH